MTYLSDTHVCARMHACTHTHIHANAYTNTTIFLQLLEFLLYLGMEILSLDPLSAPDCTPPQRPAGSEGSRHLVTAPSGISGRNNTIKDAGAGGCCPLPDSCCTRRKPSQIRMRQKRALGTTGGATHPRQLFARAIRLIAKHTAVALTPRDAIELASGAV